MGNTGDRRRAKIAFTKTSGDIDPTMKCLFYCENNTVDRTKFQTKQKYNIILAQSEEERQNLTDAGFQTVDELLELMQQQAHTHTELLLDPIEPELPIHRVTPRTLLKKFAAIIRR
jgi:hypothetical protein